MGPSDGPNVPIDRTVRIGNDGSMLEREAAIAWYGRNRARSRALFDLLTPDVYYQRPIELRHPIVFYEGHLPGFSFNTLVKRALAGPSIDPRLEAIFARGIDPPETLAQGPAAFDLAQASNGGHHGSGNGGWPARDEVRAFVEEADHQVLDALYRADLDRPGHPLLDHAEAVFAVLEHEAMHHETLLYMWHRLPFENKHAPVGYAPRVSEAAPRQEWINIPGGMVTLGVDRDEVRFGWDNEFPRHEVEVDDFSIERFNVTNAQFLEFVEAGGYGNAQWWRPEDWKWIQHERMSHPLSWEGRADVPRHNHHEWYWRGMFEHIPLPLAWPVYVTHAEAAAYVRWRGARLMTEAEYQRAAYGVLVGSPDAERDHPWGNVRPSPERGVFDFSSWDPEPVGSHPKGRSTWGVEDLAGNGWEWTGTVFAPFPGFGEMASYPEYSADFFDGEHMVVKGASPATAAEFLRPTFRNWFRPRYPYVYATFRCVTPLTRSG